MQTKNLNQTHQTKSPKETLQQFNQGIILGIFMNTEKS